MQSPGQVSRRCFLKGSRWGADNLPELFRVRGCLKKWGVDMLSTVSPRHPVGRRRSTPTDRMSAANSVQNERAPFRFFRPPLREKEELHTPWSKAAIRHWRQQSVPHSGRALRAMGRILQAVELIPREISISTQAESIPVPLRIQNPRKGGLRSAPAHEKPKNREYFPILDA
jgi:hypothetical protein